jgi:pimeloyl-ACP methyl ester carboxylesterase
VPTLTLHGDRDGAIDARIFARTDGDFVGGYTRKQLDGAGHFLHREQPERVAREIIDFLGEPRRVP